MKDLIGGRKIMILASGTCGVCPALWLMQLKDSASILSTGTSIIGLSLRPSTETSRPRRRGTMKQVKCSLFAGRWLPRMDSIRFSSCRLPVRNRAHDQSESALNSSSTDNREAPESHRRPTRSSFRPPTGLCR